MANVIYYGAGYINFNSFCKYDFDALAVTRLADCPVAINARGIAWDGRYIYAVGTNGAGVGQIARYDPPTNTWLVMNSGRPMALSGNGIACTCDGSTVFILNGGTIFGYNIAGDSLAALAGISIDGARPAICWDYSDTLWIIPQTTNGAQQFLKKYTISANTVVQQPLTGVSTINFNNVFYTSGQVWATSSDYNTGLNYIAPLVPDNNGNLVFSEGTRAPISFNGEGVLIGPTTYSVGSGNGSANLVDINSLSLSNLSTAPYQYAYQGAAFTLALNTLFTIYKADGVTLAPGTDILQNGKPYSAGKFAGPIEYQIQAASPRQTVTVAIVNVATSPFSKFASISTSPTGPFIDGSGNPIQSVSIGPMNAGQKVAVYVGDQIPKGATPGTYSFAFNVTSA